MAKDFLFCLTLAFLVKLSPPPLACKINPCELMRVVLPPCATTMDYIFERDYDSLVITRRLGLMHSNTSYFVLPLLSCHITRLFHKMIMLPSSKKMHTGKKTL